MGTVKLAQVVALGLLSGIVLAAPSPSRALDVVRLAAIATDDIGNATIFAAEDLRYFAANGVSVESTKYRGAGAGQEALAAGAADISIIPPPAVAISVSRGVRQKIVAVGPTVKNNGWSLMVSDKSGIQSPKDLAGKKVGVTSKNSLTDYFALWIQQKYGVNFQIVPMGGGGVQALTSGQIDAYTMSPLLNYRLMAGGGVRNIVDFGAEPYIPTTFSASADFLEKKPKAVRGFVDAVFRAVKHMHENKPYALGVLKKFTGRDDEPFLERLYSEVVLNLSTDWRAKRSDIAQSAQFAVLGGMPAANLPAVDTFTSADIYSKP